MLDFLGDLRRTHRCGTLRASDAGTKAVLMGWVNRRRDLGNLIFIDLRDRTGVTQVVLNRELDRAAHDKANTFPLLELIRRHRALCYTRRYHFGSEPMSACKRLGTWAVVTAKLASRLSPTRRQLVTDSI